MRHVESSEQFSACGYMLRLVRLLDTRSGGASRVRVGVVIGSGQLVVSVVCRAIR